MDYFFPFSPLTAHKIKIFKKWKKHLEISSFYIYVPKIMIRWCTLPEICCVTDVIVISHFGLFFPLLPPIKLKIFKNEKNTRRYHHFTYTKNYDQMYGSWDMLHDESNYFLSDCNGTQTHNHLVRKRTLKHLAKLTKWLSWVVSTYLYCAFDCMFLSCHVRVSE